VDELLVGSRQGDVRFVHESISIVRSWF
jgi:hypothetical protein